MLTLVITAIFAAYVFSGAPVGARADGPVRPANLEMTPEALVKAPAQNKMVWLACPKAKTLPVIDGTLHLEEGEWDSASAVYGMLDPRPGLLLPLNVCLVDVDSWHRRVASWRQRHVVK